MMKVSTFKIALLSVSAVCLYFALGSASVQAQAYDSSAAAAAEIRFQQLEKEIRRLTGQIEEQNYEIRRLKEELAKVTDDLEMRVKALEGGAPDIKTTGSSASYQPTKIDTTPPVMGESVVEKAEKSQKETQILGSYTKSAQTGDVRPPTDAASSYDYAYSFIKARNFDRAEDEFAKFMSEYPDHPLVSNAKYWYGETFYVRGNYEKAARIFAEGYQQYPKGTKAPSNLLKLGMSLTGMGKKQEACIAYRQLKNEYSRTSVPVLKRAETEMKKIGC